MINVCVGFLSHLRAPATAGSVLEYQQKAELAPKKLVYTSQMGWLVSAPGIQYVCLFVIAPRLKYQIFQKLYS